jgi:hypothetical protein
MDTLVYIYRNRGKDTGVGKGQLFRLKKLTTEKRCIIYLGLGREFLQNGPKKEPVQNAGGQDDIAVSLKERKITCVIKFWKRRKRIAELAEKGEESPEKEAERELLELQSAIRFLADEIGEVYSVYEDSLEEMLLGERLNSVWSKVWQFPKYEEWREPEWMDRLMDAATCNSFLILGYHEYIGTLLKKRVRRIKSVVWMLPAYIDVDDLLEYFAVEYGLVIELRVLPEGTDWMRMRPESIRTREQEPVNVLDFSGEPRMNGGNLPPGSVWLDMDSIPDKQRRILKSGGNVTYFSARMWMEAKKNSLKS